jgi:predicted house-cleaning noncanonical NTP pyrophosphatase (MazG superfamily)
VSAEGKLVRDRIPEIIRAAGGEPHTRRLQGDELIAALLDKVVEEAHELREASVDQRIEEMADLLEVLAAVAERLGVTLDQVQDVGHIKRSSRGGFNDGLFLYS